MINKNITFKDLSVYEREIVQLRREMSIMSQKGFFQYADSIDARIREIELLIKSKKILY